MDNAAPDEGRDDSRREERKTTGQNRREAEGHWMGEGGSFERDAKGVDERAEIKRAC